MQAVVGHLDLVVLTRLNPLIFLPAGTLVVRMVKKRKHLRKSFHSRSPESPSLLLLLRGDTTFRRKKTRQQKKKAESNNKMRPSQCLGRATIHHPCEQVLKELLPLGQIVQEGLISYQSATAVVVAIHCHLQLKRVVLPFRNAFILQHPLPRHM